MFPRLRDPDRSRLHSFGNFLHAPVYDEQFVGVSWSGLADTPSAVELHYEVETMPARYCSVATRKAGRVDANTSFRDYIDQQIANERFRAAHDPAEIEDLLHIPFSAQRPTAPVRPLRKSHVLVDGMILEAQALEIEGLHFLHAENGERAFFLTGTSGFLNAEFSLSPLDPMP